MPGCKILFQRFACSRKKCAQYLDLTLFISKRDILCIIKYPRAVLLHQRTNQAYPPRIDQGGTSMINYLAEHIVGFRSVLVIGRVVSNTAIVPSVVSMPQANRIVITITHFPTIQDINHFYLQFSVLNQKLCEYLVVTAAKFSSCSFRSYKASFVWLASYFSRRESSSAA